MAHQRQIREAAGEHVEDFADYDDEFDLHQALVSDETFGVLAHCLEELRTQRQHGELSSIERDHAGAAADELRAAMEERAAAIREEVQG